MENPQNGVKNEEDMKNEEEDISKDDMEEATLDEEDLEEGMVEEGPKKLRARATANSSDVIRYEHEKIKTMHKYDLWGTVYCDKADLTWP